MRRVLVAPDKFKGSFTAAEVCAALAEGVRLELADVEVRCLPLADGGEGTLEVLLAARGGTAHALRVTGPTGDPADAVWAMLDDGWAAIETARACGLALVSPARRDPERATTKGVGELVREALAAGATRVLLGLGGSATVDGGRGMAEALGYRFDTTGIDATGVIAGLREVRFVALCDVRSPLLGPQGAACVFAPQKGATSAAQVERLERRLAALARAAERDLGVATALRAQAGAGAAGGLGWGAACFLGAELAGASDFLLDAAGFDGALAAADFVLTGEGAWDAASRLGKVAGEVVRRARARGVPVAVVCARGDAGAGVFRGEDLPGRGAGAPLDRAGLVAVARRAARSVA